MAKGLVRLCEVKDFRVEAFSDPFYCFLMLLVLRVAEGGKKVLVAPNPAAIIGRAGPLPGQAFGAMKSGLSRRYLLNPYLMHPTVAHVVLVEEFSAGRWRDILEDDPAFVLNVVPIRSFRAKTLFADMEHVQMAVAPAHDILDDPVEFRQAGVARC